MGAQGGGAPVARPRSYEAAEPKAVCGQRTGEVPAYR